MRPTSPKSVHEYLREDGSSPYRDWLSTLDIAVKARIQARVLRFESGNLGDHKSVGEGVLEARLDFGPGYRVYFGLDGEDIVLLLIGGHKKSQRGDIRQAREYWKEYLYGKKK
jgi:putative addiction module killer protein